MEDLGSDDGIPYQHASHFVIILLDFELLVWQRFLGGRIGFRRCMLDRVALEQWYRTYAVSQGT